MAKIIFGTLILLGSVGNILRPDFQLMSYMDAESIGYNLGVYTGIILGIWLIQSGRISRQKISKPTFFEFIAEFFTKYKNFLKNYISDKRPPYLFILIWVYGMTLAFNLMESGIIKSSIWVSAMINVAIFGVILGIVGYWLIGSIYHLGVILSGGQKNAKKSRYIFLYKGIPVYIVAIITKIIDSIIYGDGYFVMPTILGINICWIILNTIAFVYALVLSYKAVVYIQNTKPVRSAIFFIVIPALIFVIIFGKNAMGAVKYYSEGVAPNEQALELINEGRYDEAEQLLNKALDSLTITGGDSLPVVYENLALLNDYQGDKEKAIEYYNASLSLTQENTSHYYYLLGQIGLLETKYQEAVDDLEKALELNPENGEAHNILGLIYSGQIDSDIEVNLEKAIFHNQFAFELIGDINTLQNLAINYFDAGKYEEALQAFIYLDELKKDNASAKYYLGLLYYLGDEKEVAKKYMEEAISLNPELEGEDSSRVLQD